MRTLRVCRQIPVRKEPDNTRVCSTALEVRLCRGRAVLLVSGLHASRPGQPCPAAAPLILRQGHQAAPAAFC